VVGEWDCVLIVEEQGSEHVVSIGLDCIAWRTCREHNIIVICIIIFVVYRLF
jgi:hypothetical protein